MRLNKGHTHKFPATPRRPTKPHKDTGKNKERNIDNDTDKLKKLRDKHKKRVGYWWFLLCMN